MIQNVDCTCSCWITCVAVEDAKQMDAGDGASGDAGNGCPCFFSSARRTAHHQRQDHTLNFGPAKDTSSDQWPQVVCEVDLHGSICHSGPFVSHQEFLLLKLSCNSHNYSTISGGGNWWRYQYTECRKCCFFIQSNAGFFWGIYGPVPMCYLLV